MLTHSQRRVCKGRDYERIYIPYVAAYPLELVHNDFLIRIYSARVFSAVSSFWRASHFRFGGRQPTPHQLARQDNTTNRPKEEFLFYLYNWR